MNFRLLKLAFKNRQIRNRIFSVLIILLIFRLLSHIPVPIGNPADLRLFLEGLFANNRFLGFIDMFSGGALANFSIVLMGLGPYINASIIMQLMGQVVPKISELKKEGEAGRKKINQYTRMLTLPLAMGQAVGSVFFLKRLSAQSGQIDIVGNPTLAQWVLIISVITAGSVLLMWLGEILSEKGIGNGISLLIFAGIIAQLPAMSGQLFSLLQTDASKIITVLLFIFATILTTYFIVKLNEGQRRVTVSYAKRVQGSKAYGGVESTLPIRVITAGVIPIIFAVAFLSVPPFLSQIFINAETIWVAGIAQNVSNWFAPTSNVYAVVYFSLVVLFTYFYTGVVFNVKDIAENLQKQGGFIPGIRPGKQTADYLKRVVNRITLFGSISLGLIAILPFIAERITGSSILTIGGTGLLIVVSVAIESLRQLESQTVMLAYE
ncbi:MAG: preprotein translocase subunit SecY [Candidatus Saccharimonadales bacterium]